MGLGSAQALGHTRRRICEVMTPSYCAHKGAVGDGAGNTVHVRVDRKCGELLHDGLEREGHIGAGVSIGNREHVELVDLLSLVGNSRNGDGKTGSNGLCNHLFWHFRLVNAGGR